MSERVCVEDGNHASLVPALNRNADSGCRCADHATYEPENACDRDKLGASEHQPEPDRIDKVAQPLARLLTRHLGKPRDPPRSLRRITASL